MTPSRPRHPLLRAAQALLAAGLLSAALGAPAAPLGSNPPAPPLNAARIAELPPAQREAWRRYLAASQQQRQADQAALAAERAAGAPVPPPPPSAHSEATMPLDKPAAWYAGAEARQVAENMLSFQTPAGGWGKNQPRDQPPRAKGQAYVANNNSPLAKAGDFDLAHEPAWSYVGTIDNDATLTEVQFLARVQAQLPEADAAPYRASALRGIRYLLRAQFPNGGWPQVWPLQGGYHDAITINDNAMVGVLELLGRVARGDDAFGFVPAALRAEVAAAEQRGIDNLVTLQMRVNGRRMLWGQQHDALTLQAVSARNYEPPALCSVESGQLLDYLMSLPEPSPAVAEAIEAGIVALRELELHDLSWGRAPNEPARGLHPQPGARGLWARYYDPVTLKPVFGDRDKSLHDDVRDISVERRNGYNWFVTGPRKTLQAYPEWATRVGRKPV